jgi:Ribonuclease G/E
MDALIRPREIASTAPMERKMDDEEEIKRLKARINELKIDSQAIFTGAVTHEINAELKAAKKRLAELEKHPHPKG